MNRIESFQPIINQKSRVLILGSIPGVQSLQKQQYYGNPYNQFWKIIHTIFAVPYETDYNRRISLVQDRGLAIWDVIRNCQREGSLDSNIKDETINDFEWLFSAFPNLTFIAFNGGKAFELYRKRVGIKLKEMQYKQLPSTSPANTMKFEEKLKQWRIILDYL